MCCSRARHLTGKVSGGRKNSASWDEPAVVVHAVGAAWGTYCDGNVWLFLPTSKMSSLRRSKWVAFPLFTCCRQAHGRAEMGSLKQGQRDHEPVNPSGGA